MEEKKDCPQISKAGPHVPKITRLQSVCAMCVTDSNKFCPYWSWLLMNSKLACLWQCAHPRPARRRYTVARTPST